TPSWLSACPPTRGSRQSRSIGPRCCHSGETVSPRARPDTFADERMSRQPARWGVNIDPYVSVRLPVRDEAPYIERATASIVRAGEPAASFEIIVVDGMSDDGTRSLVAGLSARDKRILLRDNPQRPVPHAMNLGIRSARGAVIVRIDGH